MIVVGTGCGPGMLTEKAIELIGSASLIYGSDRAIELVVDHIPPSAEVRKIVDYSNLDALPDCAVVLSTGDPMLAGLGGPGRTVIPGISSMQVAFSRLGLGLVGSSIVSAHGASHSRAIEEAIQELKRGKTVFLLTEPSFPFSALVSALEGSGEACRLAVCEELGYERERVAVGTPQAPPEALSKLYSVVIGKW